MTLRGVTLGLVDSNPNVDGAIDSRHTSAMQRVVEVMSSRLSEDLTHEDMADIACFSPFHFNRVFREFAGIPPIQFLYALRIERAKELLLRTEANVTDICFEVGYGSLGTFSTRFKELVGVTPADFRKLSRRLAGFRISNLRSFVCMVPKDGLLPICLSGPIDQSIPFEGVAFVGLFRRAIPEGLPAACDVQPVGGIYAIPLPAAGIWHAMAVAFPWSVAAEDLLMLSGKPRGKSGPITVRKDGWSGDSRIVVRPLQFCDPPILTAIPLFLIRKLIGARDGPDAVFARTEAAPAAASLV